MSKEMERLKSKIELYKGLINLFDSLNFIYKYRDSIEFTKIKEIEIYDNLSKSYQSKKSLRKYTILQKKY